MCGSEHDRYFNSLDMDYVKKEKKMPVCLECGDKIGYGRSDKKFCCEDCKNRYYNGLSKGSRKFKRKVMVRLTKNYQILEQIIKSGESSVELTDLVSFGFTPDTVTGFHKNRFKSDEYWCFDIKYRMTDSRVYSISKLQNVSLNLQIDSE